MSLRLLALDVDGTLTDPTGEIRPRVRDAVRTAQASGIRVVLCTGRRFRRIQHLIEMLRLDGEVVIQNGVVIKDADSTDTLHALHLAPELGSTALGAMSDAGPPLIYVDQHASGIDILTSHESDAGDRAHDFQRAYVGDMSECTRLLDREGSTGPESPVVMISWMGDTQRLTNWRVGLDTALAGRARTNLIRNVGYGGSILEVCHSRSGKWAALEWIARRAGISASEIAAVGDDFNDLEMIREAGLGIAMSNAPPDVRAIADHVTRSNAEEGLAYAIEKWVLDRPR